MKEQRTEQKQDAAVCVDRTHDLQITILSFLGKEWLERSELQSDALPTELNPLVFVVYPVWIVGLLWGGWGYALRVCGYGWGVCVRRHDSWKTSPVRYMGMDSSRDISASILHAFTQKLG